MSDVVLRSRPLWQGEESIAPYAERSEPKQSKLDRFIVQAYAAVSSGLSRGGSARLGRMADAVDALGEEFAGVA
jgi:hypothetical protein